MHAYARERRTLAQLAASTGRDVRWVRGNVYAAPRTPVRATPQPTVIIPDTTFWGQSYEVTVFRSPSLKRNLWWKEVTSERIATYREGRRALEAAGWTITAAVVDGRRGLERVFDGIPVQLCIFHQMKRVTTYLTRRPKTEAGQELRALTLRLPRSTEADFTEALAMWHERWAEFINERTDISTFQIFFYEIFVYIVSASKKEGRNSC